LFDFCLNMRFYNKMSQTNIEKSANSLIKSVELLFQKKGCFATITIKHCVEKCTFCCKKCIFFGQKFFLQKKKSNFAPVIKTKL